MQVLGLLHVHCHDAVILLDYADESKLEFDELLNDNCDEWILWIADQLK